MSALCWPWLRVVTMGVHALESKADRCVMHHLCAPLFLLRLHIVRQGHDQPVDILPIDLHMRVQQVAVPPRLEAPQQCVLPPVDADQGPLRNLTEDCNVRVDMSPESCWRCRTSGMFLCRVGQSSPAAVQTRGWLRSPWQ
jgi:hypothetical protein